MTIIALTLLITAPQINVRCSPPNQGHNNHKDPRKTLAINHKIPQIPPSLLRNYTPTVLEKFL